MEQFFDLEEIVLIPSPVNDGKFGLKDVNYMVEDSIDCTIFRKSLPIFTSPTESVIGDSNLKLFAEKGIRPVLPITLPLDQRLEMSKWLFSSFTPGEARSCFLNNRVDSNSQYHISIDCENGHNFNVINMCNEIKSNYAENQIIIMLGNVGCPEVYKEYSKAKIDYMRIGIASSSLIDPSKFGFHYPMASLLESIKIFKKTGAVGLRPVKIVADGGINCISDIIKCIALGADYVMIGRQFARLLEANGSIYKKVSGSGSGMEVVSAAVLSKFKTGQACREQGFKRPYFGTISLESKAKREGYSSVAEWKKANPKIRTEESNWDWLDIDQTLDEWLDDFKEIVDNAFIMSNTNCWEDFRKKIKYGRVSYQ